MDAYGPDGSVGTAPYTGLVPHTPKINQQLARYGVKFGTDMSVTIPAGTAVRGLLEPAVSITSA